MLHRIQNNILKASFCPCKPDGETGANKSSHRYLRGTVCQIPSASRGLHVLHMYPHICRLWMHIQEHSSFLYGPLRSVIKKTVGPHPSSCSKALSLDHRIQPPASFMSLPLHLSPRSDSEVLILEMHLALVPLSLRNKWISYAYQTSQVALVVKNLPVNAGDIRDIGSIPESGRSPGEGNGNSLQYSCLENPEEPDWLQSIGLHRVRHD